MIYLGADHGGFKLKEKIKEWLTQNHYSFEDLGNAAFDPGDDYPEIAFKVAEKVSGEGKKLDNKGVLLCRSAAGMVIAANKVKGIRAVAAFDKETAEHSRKHNNSNVLALSGDRLNDLEAFDILKAWLETQFSNLDRYIRRLKAIEEYEEAQK